MFTRYWLGNTYAALERYEEAIREYQEAIRFSPEDSLHLSGLCAAYSLAGRKSDALKVLEQLKELANRRYVSPGSFAGAYMSLGDHQKDLEFLESGYRDRDSLLCFIKVSWIFDDLGSDPRFQEIVRKMNFPQK